MRKPGAITPEIFRRVLGQFPTGVAVVTAMGRAGQPVGMAVGSFTSVSLEPPMVGFLPAVTSKTWHEIEAVGRFCVNILSAGQELLCRHFSRSGGDKFAGVSWFASPNGAPVLTDSLAWIDCDIDRVDPAGDHFVVLGAVTGMQVQSESSPLVFLRGGYGSFRPGALVAGDPQGDLVVPLRIVDLARQDIDALSRRWNIQCAVTAMVGDEIVVLAVAGATEDGVSNAFIGVRNPAIPPFGVSFMAWQSEERVAGWLASAPPGEATDTLRARLDAMRSQGFAVSLEGGGVRDWEEVMSASPEGGGARRDLLLTRAQPFVAQLEAIEPERVRNVHVPVLGPDGRVGVVLNVGGFTSLDAGTLAEFVADIRRVAERISVMSGGPQLTVAGQNAPDLHAG